MFPFSPTGIFQCHTAIFKATFSNWLFSKPGFETLSHSHSQPLSFCSLPLSLSALLLPSPFSFQSHNCTKVSLCQLVITMAIFPTGVLPNTGGTLPRREKAVFVHALVLYAFMHGSLALPSFSLQTQHIPLKTISG